MNPTAYVRLKDLVGSTFEVIAVPKFTWKMWDQTEKKMLSSDVYVEGYQKKYQVETNKGNLDLGSGQMGNLLEAVFYQGRADLIGKTFEVSSNGKEGMDIRYYFKVLRNTPTQSSFPDTLPDTDAISLDTPVNLDDIPF